MFLLLFSLCMAKLSHLSYYTASVFEYHPIGNEKESIFSIAYRNLQTYANVTTLAAKNNADIIVFPEYGLYPFVSRAKFRNVAQFVPDPTTEDWNPCTDPDRYLNTFIVRYLSCMARDNFIFLVSNFISMQRCNTSQICHPDGVFLYNTNAVFDRRGKLVARYYKYHLFDEPGINVPSKPEFVTFDTDFGKFGTFICFDIYWKEAVELLQKKEVDSIAYTSWWKDIFPSHSSIQAYYSWSLRFNMNLLAANKNIPGEGATGSGIFRGTSISPAYIYNPDGRQRLILAKIPRPKVKKRIDPNYIVIENGRYHPGNNLSTGVCSTKTLGPAKDDYDYRCFEEDLSRYTLIKLRKTAERIQVCNNGFCCRLQYKISNSFLQENYYLIVNNGSSTIENYSLQVEMCGLVRCDDFKGKLCSVFPTKANTVFDELSIKANFTTHYVYPNVLASEIMLLNGDKWKFSNSSITLTQSMDKGLLSATLLGRCYDRDPPRHGIVPYIM